MGSATLEAEMVSFPLGSTEGMPHMPTEKLQLRRRLAKMGAELTVAWLRQHLHVPEGYPAWLVDGNWDQVPQE